MDAEATETSVNIICDETYFIDVHLLVYYVVKYTSVRGYGAYKGSQRVRNFHFRSLGFTLYLKKKLVTTSEF
jgi:hypothetical protein